MKKIKHSFNVLSILFRLFQYYNLIRVNTANNACEYFCMKFKITRSEQLTWLLNEFDTFGF